MEYLFHKFYVKNIRMLLMLPWDTVDPIEVAAVDHYCRSNNAWAYVDASGGYAQLGRERRCANSLGKKKQPMH
jgi:hypothetical protein